MYSPQDFPAGALEPQPDADDFAIDAVTSQLDLHARREILRQLLAERAQKRRNRSLEFQDMATQAARK